MPKKTKGMVAFRDKPPAAWHYKYVIQSVATHNVVLQLMQNISCFHSHLLFSLSFFVWLLTKCLMSDTDSLKTNKKKS